MPYTTNTYPTNIDAPVDPVASDDTSVFDHAGLEKYQNDSITAIETKVGKTGDTNTASHDYKLSSITGANKALSSDLSGIPDAAVATKGLTRLSTAPVVASTPIAVGDNDGRVPTQAENDALVGSNTDIAVGTGNKFITQTGTQKNAEKYAADTSASSTAYVITLSPVPISYTIGMVIYAKIVTANTTTTPTINVNSLGAKTIVKSNSVALSIGDIGANHFCTFIYDGTNFVLQNPTANTVSLISQPLAVQTASVNGGNGSASEVDVIANTNVPGSSLSTGRAIRFEGCFSVANLSTFNTVTVKIYYGGSAVGTFSFGGLNSTLSTYYCNIVATIAYTGASAQYVSGIMTGYITSSASTGNPYSTVSTTSAVASASNQNVKMTITGTSASNATGQITFIGSTIHLI